MGSGKGVVDGEDVIGVPCAERLLIDDADAFTDDFRKLLLVGDKMAIDTNSPIVPFVITGKYKLFSKSLTIKFLEPIKCNGDIKEETERLMNIIKKERGKE